MIRKSLALFVIAAALLVAGCHHAKVQNPIANIDSKQPDKVLYDRAMDAMKHAKYTVARALLETLINTYPDSEYIARAKLSVGDSWYAEGGTAALAQAEAEYKDFITFFPNLPEAAEAQLKVANIHYRQMEKPDRDYVQATRAAEEYKALIQNFPDSKLVPTAKQKLREVQEILAERQNRIAHFYYTRDNMAAAQARWESLAQSYPLYSQIDDVLYSIGQVYEREASMLRKQKIDEAAKERVAEQYKRKAIAIYSQIITRYPVMDRAESARKRLAALNAPIPTPTPEAIAQNKAEEESRGDIGRFHGFMDNFHKRPDVAKAAGAGDPPIDEEAVISAPGIVRQLQADLNNAPVPANQPPATASNANGGSEKVGVEGAVVGTGTPAPNQATPGSQNGQQQPPSTSSGPSTPPGQTNQINSSSTGTPSAAQGTQDSSQKDSSATDDSSSKKKKKKGLRKLIPF